MPRPVSNPTASRLLNLFFERLGASLDTQTFVRLTLGRPVVANPAVSTQNTPQRLLLRPVTIRGERQISMVSRFATRDETKNGHFPEILTLLRARLGTDFLSAHLVTETEETQLDLGSPKPRLHTRPCSHAPAPLEHNQKRQRWVDVRAPYLRALEVTDAQGRVRERMGDKFRQIERFVDLLASAFHESALASADQEPLADLNQETVIDLPQERSPRSLTFCDMGSGKGYLTFAAYDYFRRVEQRAVSGMGVEAREELARLCNRVAGECGFDGLRFEARTIAAFPLPQKLDILIALHACDTATDDALFAGIRAGTPIILVAPCCHKELRPQVENALKKALEAQHPLADVLRHGLFAERHAEMATDALRALLLEREGYRVRVCEFVAAEHTAKNVMLIATRRKTPHSEKARIELQARVEALKAFYGIQHQRLETLLAG